MTNPRKIFMLAILVHGKQSAQWHWAYAELGSQTSPLASMSQASQVIQSAHVGITHSASSYSTQQE